MPAVFPGVQPQTHGNGHKLSTLALRCLCTRVTSALRIAPTPLLFRQATLTGRPRLTHTVATMGQRDIASFFKAPAAACKAAGMSATPASARLPGTTPQPAGVVNKVQPGGLKRLRKVSADAASEPAGASVAKRGKVEPDSDLMDDLPSPEKVQTPIRWHSIYKLGIWSLVPPQ